MLFLKQGAIKIGILLLVFCFCSLSLMAQLLKSETSNPPALEHKILQHQANSNKGLEKTTKITAAGPIFDTARWSFLVDSTWGKGIADTLKMDVFNKIWKSIDSTYPCFVHLPLYNWDSIVNSMRSEISRGVSKGRMAGILSELRRYINDGHSAIYDRSVVYQSPYLGMPVFSDESGRFGACITMLEDSSAMVYDVVAGHPMGLQPGDIILGYNNILWKDLIKIILKYQLPSSVYVGSSNAATYHKYVKAAGENWYLFDTINIRKCNGTIISFPTSLMTSTNYNDVICTEQIAIQGLHKLSYNEYYMQGKSISYGLLPGTKIGYIYMMDCRDYTGEKLYQSVRNLVEDSLAQGLIFDLRTNYGGGFFAFQKAFCYLTNGSTSWVGYGVRNSLTNRYSLANYYPSSNYDVADTVSNSYSNPIAVICGPEAISAGDFFQLLFKKHPLVKTFGKSTASAFGAYTSINTGQSDYIASKQSANFYEVVNPTYYLSHTQYPIDYPVWFQKDSVCAGKDNIVNTAVNWIKSKTSVAHTGILSPSFAIFPNPTSGEIKIKLDGFIADKLIITLTDLFGKKIFGTQLEKGIQDVITINMERYNLTASTYFLYIESADGKFVQKLSYIR